MLHMSVHTFPVQDSALASGAGVAASKSNLSNAPRPTHTIKCSVCPKVFKRSEHCARHELSHTNERPFSCQFCHRTYARKDLVKRHERTIHAELYNALVDSSRPNPKERPYNASNLNARPRAALQTRTGSVQLEQDAADARDFSISDDETFQAQVEATTASRRATFSGDLDTIRADAATLASRPPSIPTFLPNDAIALGSASATSPGTNLGTSSLSSTDARISRPSPPQSPATGSEQFDFSFASHLVTSPFGVLPSLDSHVEVFDSEQPRSKRQRLSNDGPSMHSVRNDQPFSMSAPSPMPSGDPSNLLHPSDLMDIDLMMGRASNEFFMHQIAQQHDHILELNGATGDLLAASNTSKFVFPRPTTSSPSGRFSDSISDSGTERPDRLRLPMILREKSSNPPRLVVDDAAFQALSADIRQRLGNDEVNVPLRNRQQLQHFLNGYLDCFHRHLPILHLPTLDVSQTPSPLILSMCCIGALYRLERQKARKIYLVAVRISEAISTQHSYPSPLTSHSSSISLDNQEAGQISSAKPLWLMQAHILMLLYAGLGNDAAIVQSEMWRMGVFITEYRARRAALKAKNRQHAELRWHEWIEIEANKRFLCATFICSSLLVLIYDIAPGIGITQDLEFELLEEEKLWNAANAEDWHALRDSGSSPPPRTVRSVMGDMLAGKTNDNIDGSPYYVSGFTTLLIIHAVNMYAWNLSQFSHVSISPFSDLSGTASNTLLTNALMAFARCREVLQLARPEGIESLWNSPEGPILLNCEAMLRVAYTRLFIGTSMPEGLVLIFNPPEESARLLDNFVAAQQERTPLITKVMASMCEAFSVPSKAGYLLVQKTAAINWSVEHAVAGWGCVLLLSKWLHCLDVGLDEAPLTSTELEIVSQVKTALEGMDVDYDEKNSLAAAVVTSWASLMTDVWVWGITTKMGAILTDLAQAYETSSKRARRHRLRN